MKEFDKFYDEEICTADIGSPSNYVGTSRKKREKKPTIFGRQPQKRKERRLERQLKYILGGDTSSDTIQ